MPITFKDLPGWGFAVDEVSAGVYKVRGRDGAGRSVELTGANPESLLEECKRYAAKILSGE